jgi:hypothetical protein
MSDGRSAKKFVTRFVAFLVLFLLVSAATDSSLALAQTATGSITGTVTDPSGAAVVGAKVKVVNIGTNEAREAATNELGYYSFPLLSPGRYALSVTATGFKQFKQAVQLNVAIALTVDASLPVGDVSEVVNVSENPVALESQTASLGQVIDTRTIDDLPLNGRNSYSFTTLVPGVIAPYGFTQTAFDEYNDQFISINGSRPNASLFLLDGGNNSEPGFNGPGVYPSVDLVQEYKVMTNNFSAEFTNTAGGVINVVTRSGANALHGSVYEFFRDTGLSANNFFANSAGIPRASFNFNQFGVSLGGPIKKNKTFFFFSYEGIRWVQGVTLVATVPTAAQRVGNFSQTNNASGQLIPIFNPYTTELNPASPGSYVRQQFPGNIIPTSMIDPVAMALLKYLPLPNGPGLAGSGANNFTTDTDQNIEKNDFSLRIDQVLTQNQKLFGRFTISDTTQTRPNLYGDNPDYIISDPTVGNDFLRQMQGTLDYTAVLRPNFILELNSSYVYYLLNRHLNGFGIPPSELNLPSYFDSLGPMCFPTVYVTGMATNPSLANLGSNALFGDYCDPLNDPLDTYHEYGNLTLQKGAHMFKFGADFGRATISGTDFQYPGQFLNFGTNFTQGPDPIADTNSGVGFASFLLGLGTGTLLTGGSFERASNWYVGGYFQDDWKVTSQLTLNLGIRYDFNSPLRVQDGKMTNFNFTAPSPLQVPGLNLVGGAEFPGKNGISSYAWNPNQGNVAPRFGFAYLATKDTVVRGGVGLFTAPIDGAWFNGNGLPLSGWQGVSNWVSSLDGVTPLNPFANQFPDGFTLPTGSSLGLLTQVGQTLTAMNRNRPSSYAEQWNIDVQRTLPGDVLLDVAYTGSHGLHLFGDYNANQLPDKDLSLGSQLLSQVANPFYGKVSSGLLSGPTVPLSQLLLPYPQFTSVILGNGSTFGASTYNALNLKVVKRLSYGFSLLGSYTWSKLIDNLPASETGFPGGTYADEVYGGGGGIQNWNNLKAERSLATFDTPQSLAINGIWELPFGRNRKFFSNNRTADYFIGGWQLNGIALFQSGTPLQVTPVTNTLYNNGGVQRANWNGQNPSMPGPTSKKLSEYFNVSDFSAPAPFTYGNTSRTLGFLRTPGIANFDLSAIKDIPIKENWRLQFRAEAFNVFNRVQFGAPDTVLGDGTTGVISTQANLPREIQLAVKLLF